MVACTFIPVATLYFSVSKEAATRWVVLVVRLTSKLPPRERTLSLTSSCDILACKFVDDMCKFRHLLMQLPFSLGLEIAFAAMVWPDRALSD